MRTLFLLFVCFVLFTDHVQAQLQDFKLSDYKLPVIKRKQLEFYMDLYGGNQINVDKVEGFPQQEYQNINFSNNNTIGFNSFTNNRRKQSEQNYSLRLSPSYNSTINNDSIKDDGFDLSSEFGISSINRFYNSRKFFYETDIIISGDITNNRSDSESEGSSYEYKYNGINVNIPLLIGKGRIEQVQDARLAVYILDDLRKAGKLNRIPTKDEILELAALISKVKNERYFDYRIHKMYEIEQVDSFLRSRSIAQGNDVRYLTTIIDNWDYSSGPIRESGNRFSTGIVPQFSYSKSYTKREYILPPLFERDSKNIEGGLEYLVNFTSCRSRNLYWQRNFMIELSYLYSKSWYEEKIYDTENDYLKQEYKATLSYGWGFYPNSRTSITTGIEFTGRRTFVENDYGMYKTKSKSFSAIPSYSLDMNYYVSPRMRINLHYIAHYTYSNDDSKIDMGDYTYSKANRLNHTLSFGLKYMIF